MKVPHALVDMEIIMGIARYDVSRHVLSKIPNALGFVHREIASVIAFPWTNHERKQFSFIHPDRSRVHLRRLSV